VRIGASIRCTVSVAAAFNCSLAENVEPPEPFYSRAQRKDDGTWQFGPSWWPTEYYSPRRSAWERLIRERERLGYEIEHWNFTEEAKRQNHNRLAAIASEIASIDDQDRVDAEARCQRQALKQRVLDLARARVLDFAGAPGAQMQAAGRLCGQCCRCWKVLTDVVSVERGIGPDCWANLSATIRGMAANGRPPEIISILVGTSLGLVNLIISEATGGRHAA
jgi:hypothetical protein